MFILKSYNENGKYNLGLFSKISQPTKRARRHHSHKYRQVAAYKRFFEKKYDALSKKNKNNFKNAVVKMKNSVKIHHIFIPSMVLVNTQYTHAKSSKIIENYKKQI